jgi:hypothetical protein
MEARVSQGELLKYALGVIAQERPARSKSSTQAWLRADAFLQHESGDFDDDSEHTKSTLRAIERYYQPAFDDEEEEEEEEEQDSISNIHDVRTSPSSPRLSLLTRGVTKQSLPHDELYRAFQAMRKKKQRPTPDPHANPASNLRSRKRRREIDVSDLSEQILQLGRKTNKRRVMTRDQPIASDDLADPNADLAVLMRRHLSSLNRALRNNWICVCHKCSGLSVRLLLPQQMKGSTLETSFEVFFGVRDVLATTLQEAKITIK